LDGPFGEENPEYPPLKINLTIPESILLSI
jgi:hypothetical protein